MEYKDIKNLPELAYWFEATSDLTEQMQEQLFAYFELIQEYNKVMNLTGIDDLEGVYLKHFYDSLTIRPLIEGDNLSIADLGSGAGFPGIILAIVYPNHSFSLIEPLTKRCKFLQTVVDEIGLTNVEIINERAEDIDKKFDILTSRAVSRLNILLELSIPLLEVGGYFIPLKGAQAQTELDEAKNALRKLNSELVTIDEITLPIENSKRANLKIKKLKATDKKYPRNFGQIKNKPL